MTGNEEKSIALCVRFYAKWRETAIETDGQWEAFAKDLGRLAADLEGVKCPVGCRMFDAVIDAINDLYKNGMVPVGEDYLGRDDL